jgi:hypothetical protein
MFTADVLLQCCLYCHCGSSSPHSLSVVAAGADVKGSDWGRNPCFHECTSPVPWSSLASPASLIDQVMLGCRLGCRLEGRVATATILDAKDPRKDLRLLVVQFTR